MTNGMPAESPADLTLQIEGMHCPNCASAVQRVLQAQPGVESANVDLMGKRAQVTGAEFSADKLVAAVEQLGYKASPA